MATYSTQCDSNFLEIGATDFDFSPGSIPLKRYLKKRLSIFKKRTLEKRSARWLLQKSFSFENQIVTPHFF